MTIKKTLLGLMPLALLTACGGGPETKVLVIAKGTIEHNGNNVTVKDGSGYAQLEITIPGKGKNQITADGPNGKVSKEIEAPGYYVLSLRADTVVGAYQKLATSSAAHMSQEELKAKIDSLQQLTAGANISTANHNYLVAPNSLVKVSENAHARVYGPFHKVPDTIAPSEDGKEVEIYKFSTNNEIRELIGKLSKLTQSEAKQ